MSRTVARRIVVGRIYVIHRVNHTHSVRQGECMTHRNATTNLLPLQDVGVNLVFDAFKGCQSTTSTCTITSEAPNIGK